MTTQFFSLNDYTLVAIEGPDAEKFLQGQVTSDVRQLNESRSLIGAHCNHKGRAITSFRAAQGEEQQILLRLHKSVLDITQQSLGKYIVFSKAELKVEPAYQLIGLSGDGALKQIKQWFGSAPETNSSLSTELGIAIGLEGNRFECWIKQNHLNLIEGLDLQPCEQWQLLDIQAGIGEVREETSETFIPQFLNFDLLEGISFNKGCYTGQEVVARMHYLGKQKRRMQRFSLSSTNPLPAPGSIINEGSSDSAKGEVVSAAHVSDQQIELLAVINGELSAPTLNGTGLTKLDLPYSIADSEDTE